MAPKLTFDRFFYTPRVPPDFFSVPGMYREERGAKLRKVMERVDWRGWTLDSDNIRTNAGDKALHSAEQGNGTVGADPKSAVAAAKTAPTKEDLEDGDAVEGDGDDTGGSRGVESTAEPAGCEGKGRAAVPGPTCCPLGIEGALVTSRPHRRNVPCGVFLLHVFCGVGCSMQCVLAATAQSCGNSCLHAGADVNRTFRVPGRGGRRPEGPRHGGGYCQGFS